MFVQCEIVFLLLMQRYCEIISSSLIKKKREEKRREKTSAPIQNSVYSQREEKRCLRVQFDLIPWLLTSD